MTIGDIATFARNLTNTDSTTWSNADVLIGINAAYQKIVSMILESQDESDFDDARRTNYPVQTTPLVAEQRDYQLPVSEKVLKIKRVDITYDGTNYYRALPIDDGVPTFDMGANTSITDRNFTYTAPRYDVKYNSIWIYPVATAAQVAAGAVIRVEWTRQVSEFTSAELTTGTAVPGFDDPYHPLLAYTTAYDYAVSRQLPQLAQIQTLMQDYELRLRQHYGQKVIDRTLVLQSLYDDCYGR